MDGEAICFETLYIEKKNPWNLFVIFWKLKNVSRETFWRKQRFAVESKMVW